MLKGFWVSKKDFQIHEIQKLGPLVRQRKIYHLDDLSDFFHQLKQGPDFWGPFLVTDDIYKNPDSLRAYLHQCIEKEKNHEE